MRAGDEALARKKACAHRKSEQQQTPSSTVRHAIMRHGEGRGLKCVWGGECVGRGSSRRRSGSVAHGSGKRVGGEEGKIVPSDT